MEPNLTDLLEYDAVLVHSNSSWMNATAMGDDLIGRKITTLVDEIQSGEQTVEFKSDNLASGLYIYTLHLGDISYSRKIVVETRKTFHHCKTFS